MPGVGEVQGELLGVVGPLGVAGAAGLRAEHTKDRLGLPAEQLASGQMGIADCCLRIIYRSMRAADKKYLNRSIERENCI